MIQNQPYLIVKTLYPNMKNITATLYALLFILFWMQMTIFSHSSIFSIRSLQVLLVGLLVLTTGIISNYISYNYLKLKLDSITYRFGSGLVFYTLLSIIAVIFFRNRTFDVQIHDTYFVIAILHITMLCAIIFAFFTLIYKALDKSISKLFGNIHFVSLISATLLILIQSYYSSEMAKPRGFYSFDTYEVLIETKYFFISIGLIIGFLLVVQLMFLLNIIVSFIKKLMHKQTQQIIVDMT